MARKSSRTLISKVVSKKSLDKNAQVLKSYDTYRKTSDLIERVAVALGRKPTLRTDVGSTLNIKINYYGVSSTTAQKI